MVICCKVLKKVENPIFFNFCPKNSGENPFFEAQSFSNLKLDPRVIFGFKNLNFKLLDTPIAIKTSLKQ